MYYTGQSTDTNTVMIFVHPQLGHSTYTVDGGDILNFKIHEGRENYK